MIWNEKPINSSEDLRCKYNNAYWVERSKESKRNFIIKKIAIVILTLINLAALSAAAYFILVHCKLSARNMDPILFSPFIAGAIGALAYIKFPTCGISTFNYQSSTNPSYLAGRILGCLFFGPVVYAANKMDWIPYHDAMTANRISRDLEKLPFDNLADKYGRHFSNLSKYGFIHPNDLQQVLELYREYKPLKKVIIFWKKEELSENPQFIKAEAEIKKINDSWENLKEKLSCNFPHPPCPNYNFSSKLTHVKLKLRELFCFRAPLDVPKFLKT
jgi:hypothetical protein